MSPRCKQFAPPSSKGYVLRQLSVYEKIWPVAGSFTISRSSLTHIPTVWVEISEKGHMGRAECRPYSRYGQTVESVIFDIESVRDAIESGLNNEELNTLMPPGPARNALDCALWDLSAQQTGVPVFKQLGLSKPPPKVTAFTLSLQAPKDMAAAALKAKNYPLLKIKVDGESVLECSQSVIATRPDAKLIIDANEDLTHEQLNALLKALPPENIAMIEQPLASHISIEVPFKPSPVICADESLHAENDITEADLQVLWEEGYRAINVKLDKCGGLSAAFALINMAKSLDFQIMAGCMVGSSLAMAPMAILADCVDVLDLDGPLLLAEDCQNGLTYEGAMLHPPTSKLWG